MKKLFIYLTVITTLLLFISASNTDITDQNTIVTNRISIKDFQPNTKDTVKSQSILMLDSTSDSKQMLINEAKKLKENLKIKSVQNFNKKSISIVKQDQIGINDTSSDIKLIKIDKTNQLKKNITIETQSEKFIEKKYQIIPDKTINLKKDQFTIDSYKTIEKSDTTSDGKISIMAVPSAPSLVSPGYGARVNGISVSFQWTTISGATDYEFQLATDSYFNSSSLEVDETLGGVYNSISFSSGFPDNGTTYYWRVRAYNSSGWGYWSSVSYFINGPSATPAIPYLSSPYNGQNISGTSVVLEWDYSNRAATFYLQVSTDSSFSGNGTFIDEDVGATLGVILNLDDDGTRFYWRVKAGNSLGYSGWSSTWSFINGPSSIPGTPYLLSPYNGANIGGTSVVLEWDYSNRAATFYLQVSTDSSFSSSGTFIDEDIGPTLHAGINLVDNGERLYWRVKAGNSLGYSGWSSTWSFVNGPSAPPAVPNLLRPINGANNSGTSVVLEWDYSNRAATFYLQVSTDSSFSSSGTFIDEDIGPTLHASINLLDNGERLYWRIKAGNSLGYSGWSSTWSFVNGPSAPPDIPVLTSPSNGANISGPDIDFRWNYANRAYTFELQVAIDRYFTDESIIIDYSSDYLLGLSVEELFDNGMDLYWRVRAGNSLGWSPWSYEYMLTNGPSSYPVVPALISPANGTVVADTKVFFSWNNTPRAYTYHFQLAEDKYFGYTVFDKEFDLANNLTLTGFDNIGETFYWRVEAKNILGKSGWSDYRSFINGKAPVLPPTGLKAVSGPGDGEITLKWNANTEADLDYYKIYAGTTSGNYTLRLNYVSPFANTGLTLYDFTVGTRYYFVVTAVNKNGYESGISNETYADAETFTTSIPPTVPENLTVVSPGTGTELKLTWSPSTDNDGMDYYLIYRLKNNNGVSETNHDADFPVTTYNTEYSDYKIERENTYYYKVQAVDIYGNRSGLSTIAFCKAGDTLAPAAPSSVAVSSGTDYINLWWNSPLNNTDGTKCTDLAGFNIYRKLSGGSYNTTPLNGSVLVTGNNYVDRNIMAGQTYCYIIKASDYQNNLSPASQEISVTVNVQDDPPSAPANVALIGKPAELEINWSKNQEADLAGYNIYRSTESGIYSGIPLNSGLIKVEKYIDRDIDPTITYFYIVKAVDNAGHESTASAEVSGKAGQGALWLIEPVAEDRKTINDTITNLNITYHLNADYLSLYTTGIILVQLDIINTAINQTIYSSVDIAPAGSSDGYNPYFNWKGINDNKTNAANGLYTVKVGLYSMNTDGSWILQVEDAEPQSVEISRTPPPPSYTMMSCDFDLSDDHWIPNDDTAIRIDNIEIWGKTAAGAKVYLTDDYQDIKFLSPIDQYWRLIEAGNSNIYKNKGTCNYVFYAKIGNERINLVRFRTNADATNDRISFNIVEYVAPYFNADGTANKPAGYYFRAQLLNGKRILHFTSGNQSTSTFYLQAEENAATRIRPGDDMLLRFTLANYENNITVPAVATSGNFMAVYDKKMLDEARRYCNNANDIEDWTNFQTNATVTDALAYGWGNWDSIDDFNTKMTGQRDAITTKRGTDANYSALNWNTVTTAPDGDWNNYLFPARRKNSTSETYDFYDYRGNLSPAQIATATQHDYYTNGSIDCIPGLSTFLAFCEDARNPVLDTVAPTNPGQRNYHWSQTTISAGTDCSGFVSRVANYNNSNYIIADGAKKNTTALASNDNSWSITNVNVLVPGDIIIRSGVHVAIVNRIIFQSNSRILPTNNNGLYNTVILIEATSGMNDEWCVINTNSWANLGANYTARRIRTND